MKFGRTLKDLADSDKQYGPMYLRYKLLRKYLKESAEARVAGQDAGHSQLTFLHMLENEHSRIKKICEIKIAELELTCEGLITNIGALQLSEQSPAEMAAEAAALTTLADELGDRLAALERFIYYNMEGFRKVVKKHDKKHGQQRTATISLSWVEHQRLRTFFVEAGETCEDLLITLSDIYQFIKDHTPDPGAEGEHAVSDETFERKSHKYWIETEYLFKFKVKVIKHLPLHFFDRKRMSRKKKTVTDLLLKKQRAESEDLGKHGWISSVYMDSDRLDSYRRRLNMEEGATLFRVRWYGNPVDFNDGMVLPRPPTKGLYFERKTHHESWVNAASVKERFPIGQEQIVAFMNGDLKPDEFVKEGKSRDLANEFQQQILKEELHPVIRTAYKRTAFQHKLTNDVRITLDTNLTLVSEHARHLAAGAWRRDELAVERAQAWDVFPHAVLEVKLKAAEPDWLAGILAEPYIRQVHKFSKFQQACATFYPEDVPAFPYWFTEEVIERVKKKHQEEMELDAASTVDSETVSEVNAMTFENAAFVKDSDITIEMGENRKVFRDPSYAHSKQNGVQNGDAMVIDMESNSKQKKVSFKVKGKKKKKNEKIATKRIKVEPKTHFANERTMLQWLRIGLTLFTLGGLIFNLSTDQRAIISGLVFMGLSALVIIYGLVVYYWRLNQILKRRSKFDDRVGPALIAAILLIAISVNIALYYTLRVSGPVTLQPTQLTG